ncbi:cob(I)yrinic acid a,c-diamide adenosyltransferase [Desulfatitalea tepidiphila]|uniref:cob(I)yrinic acid a,c-diamide adenosyltransferase n=1 Tax=Desulfatitalea tepidiphila TaxID=1185843 RepID=UPI0006B47585|nr:cob(I)yrinic acid a,c-diamide adenosyltransferase [Desulfatitalea tepidiphila]
MKIYTQTGDQGKTSLFSGERVVKSDARIHAYGDIDELNSVVGALIAVLLPDTEAAEVQLKEIQSDLFQVGAWLAATSGSEAQARLNSITIGYSQRIESWIDGMDAQLPELKSFILPGGHPTAGWAHIARTVCRRAERAVILLAEQEAAAGRSFEGFAPIVAFINRLSDYFFVLARWLNQHAGVGDVQWQG